MTRQPTTILAAEILPTTGSDLPIPTDLGPAERWIEVSLQEQMVRLHVSDRAVAEYPAATGVNTQPETTTYPGLFEVSRKYKGPIEGTPVIAGCVRVAESTAVYDFATLGMKVWIH